MDAWMNGCLILDILSHCEARSLDLTRDDGKKRHFFGDCSKITEFAAWRASVVCGRMAAINPV